MATRRLGEAPVDIPPGATVIEFRRSDGKSHQWPTNTIRAVDRDGEVNYMRHLDLDAPTSVRWRLQVARAIALDKGMPEDQEYVLAGWPEGYRLFDHNKGPENNPRHDVYLFGSAKGRFRSINEFIPHAIWLMREESMVYSGCYCKYCSKKAQKEITASMSNLLRSSPTSPSPARVKVIRERKPRQIISTGPHVRDTRTYAAVQKRPEVAKQAMLVERNSDLRAVFSKTEMKLKRWFREGELVWCALDPPILGPHEGISLDLWPAFVDETRLKSQAISRDGVLHPYVSPRKATNEDPVDEADPQEAPWMVQQYYAYKVHLLVVNRTMIVPDERILPYQSHVPPPELIETLKAYPPEKLDFNPETLRHFDPCAGHSVDFNSAIAPYAMALQIGAALSSFWSLTDEWTTAFTVPQTRSPASPPPAPAPEASIVTSLQDAIDQAHRHNAQISNLEASSASTSNGNGMRIPVPGTQITQVRYQGLWWGGERIWTDDFIRLKVPRRCLAPKGAENVYPPSGPGKSAREVWQQHGRDPSELGAGARGIFMRLDGLIVVDVTQPDGKVKKECRACGMLYELADQDWEEPPEDVDMNMNRSPQAPPAPMPILSGTDVAVGQTTAPLSTTPPRSTGSKRAVPPKSRYPLPEAPQGYRFRAILPEGHEAVISLSLISGRYYPRVLLHPLLDETLKKALTRSLEESNSLWALEGLSAGFHNSVDPTHYRGTRKVMVEEAERRAGEQLAEYTGREDGMEVDG
ncbi:hypothetical protein AX15_003092 [Amanita polypyramis BW_CC]|nr:hypothetical protein AX15_003092 [Amanita polypyramis BW_CC]